MTRVRDVITLLAPKLSLSSMNLQMKMKKERKEACEATAQGDAVSEHPLLKNMLSALLQKPKDVGMLASSATERKMNLKVKSLD